MKDVLGIILKERNYGESSKILDVFKKEYGLMLINQYRSIVNKHFYNILDRFELGENINNIGIAIDNEHSCAIDVYSFYKKINNDDNVRLIDFREENVLYKNGMQWMSSTMSKIEISKIVVDRLKKIVEEKHLCEDNCLYINIEYVLNMLFLYGKYYGFNYKFEKPNFIPNFNEFLPLNLLDLSKKIIIFNIEQLKRMDMLDNNLDNEELYQQLMIGKIDIPECNYVVHGTGKLPIYSLVNRIINIINKFSLTTIDKAHLLIPKDVDKPKNSSYVSDIIIETYTNEELIEYLKDLLSKYINEYILMVENNFPTFRDKMPYYNLFKNGVLLELYLYKVEKPFMGSYSRRLAYCNNDSDKKEVQVYFCQEKDVPKEPSKRWYSYSSGEVRSLFFDNYINNSSIRHMVLSNMIYNLLESDLKELLENEENIFGDSNE